MKLHPYAIILGVVIGVMTFVSLRNPLFAGMSGLIAVLGLDMILRVRGGGSGKE